MEISIIIMVLFRCWTYKIIVKYFDYGFAMTLVFQVLMSSSGGFGEVITFLRRKRFLCPQKEIISFQNLNEETGTNITKEMFSFCVVKIGFLFKNVITSPKPSDNS